MRTTRSAPLLALIALATAACSSVAVSTDYDLDADFAAYRTYAWIEPLSRSTAPTDSAQDELVAERIRRAVDADLAGKGLQKVAKESASLLVTEQVDVAPRIEISDPYFTGGVTQTYDEGALVLDFVDAASNQLVWRGIGRTRLRGDRTPEERNELVKNAVGEILADFPPEPKH